MADLQQLVRGDDHRATALDMEQHLLLQLGHTGFVDRGKWLIEQPKRALGQV